MGKIPKSPLALQLLFAWTAGQCRPCDKPKGRYMANEASKVQISKTKYLDIKQLENMVLPEDGDMPGAVKTQSAPKAEALSIDAKRARHLLASHSHRLAGIQKFSSSPDVSALRTKKKEAGQESTDPNAPIKLSPELQKLFGTSHSHGRTKLAHHVHMHIGQATVLKPRAACSKDAAKKPETLGSKA